MKTHKTIRYRLHPQTKTKANKLFALAGARRFIWNHFVEKLQEDYKSYSKCNPSYYTLGLQFTRLRDQLPWLQTYSANIVKYSLKPLETCYKKYWKNQGGLPRFHGKYTHPPSISLPQGTFKLNRKSLYIQKISQIKLSGNNPYPDSKCKTITIKHEAGKWYAYVVYEVETSKLPESINPVGIDRNVGQITLSDGTRYNLPDTTKLNARKRRYQKMMARRQRLNRKQGIAPSKRYLKAKLLHAKTQQRIVQARTNWCHQTSREIANKYNLTYMENLNTKGMTASAKGTIDKPGKNVKQKAGLNKAILQSGWSKLEQYLDYKTTIIKVPSAYTSQTCNKCGHTDKTNRKTQTKFHCVKCDHRANADLNAALNILASGIGATARGDSAVRRS